LVVALREEETVSSGGDLLRRGVEELASGPGLPAPLAGKLGLAVKALGAERDDQATLDLASAVLAEASATLGVVIVLVVENFDSILWDGASSDGKRHWGLRKALQAHPGLVLLAAAP